MKCWWREEGRFVVRSNKLETSLSSSNKAGDIEIYTTALKPSSLRLSSSKLSSSIKPRSFYVLKFLCNLDEEVLFRFRDRFQFPTETKIRLPHGHEKACAFAHNDVCFYEAAFLCCLRFPIRPFIMELFLCLNIAPGQLMPNLSEGI